MPFSYFPPLPENVWGNLDGDIGLQTDLIDLINETVSQNDTKTNLVINPNFRIWQRAATQIDIVNRTRSSNIVTLETAVAHGFDDGDIVQITSMSDNSYDEPDGTPITYIDSTHFTYPNTDSDESDTTETNGKALLISRVSLSPSDGAMAADRWKMLHDSNQLVVSPANNSDGMYIETNSTGKFGFLQVIPNSDVEQYLLTTLSASIELKSSVSASAKVSVLSWTGTADITTNDIVSSWNSDGTAPSLATNWHYEATTEATALTSSYQQLSIENIDIAEFGAKNLALFVWVEGLTSGEGITANKAQVLTNAHIGEFRSNSYEYDLWECKKFYQKSYSLANPPHKKTDVGRKIFPTSFGTGNGGIYGTVHLRDMYKTPTIELISSGNPPISGKWQVSTGSNVSVSTIDISEKTFSVKNDAGFTISTSHIGGHFICDSEI